MLKTKKLKVISKKYKFKMWIHIDIYRKISKIIKLALDKI